MHPGIYLEIAAVLRCKAQLYATVGAYMSGLRVAGGIFNSNPEQPLAGGPLTYLALIFH
jgi:hypothetical protein